MDPVVLFQINKDAIRRLRRRRDPPRYPIPIERVTKSANVVPTVVVVMIVNQ